MTMPSKNACVGIGSTLFGVGWVIALLLANNVIPSTVGTLMTTCMGSGVLLTGYGLWPSGHKLRGLRNLALIVLAAAILLAIAASVQLNRSS